MSAVILIARGIRTRAITALATASFALALGCTSSEPADRPSNPATDSYAASLGIDLSQFTKLTDDILYRDLTVGEGAEATQGRTVRVTYTGWLPGGQQFETNEGQAPFQFVLGTGAVVQGWDEGIVGMRAGGKRRLLIGSGAGYGRSGNGPIPPNTTMIFDVTLQSAQ
jgi:FKBP-type peptidyl-prolyl cis-trans isomerase